LLVAVSITIGNSKKEGTFAIIAAFIVLFSAMWNPLTSVIISIGTLVLYGVYKFMQK
jgi:hypothetical protein